MSGKILLVDADTTVQANLVNLLSTLGYETVLAFDGLEGVARLRSTRFDLCFTDVRLPGPDIPQVDGYAVLREARRQTPPVPVVMLTSQATITDAVHALRAGAVNFLPKPFHPSTVTEVLRRTLEAGGGGAESSSSYGVRITGGADREPPAPLEEISSWWSELEDETTLPEDWSNAGRIGEAEEPVAPLGACGSA